MQFLRKRDYSQYITPEVGLEAKSEQQFIDHLSQYIKIYKKKEEFYMKAMFMISEHFRSPTPNPENHQIRGITLKMSQLQRQHQQLMSQEEQILASILKYQEESFYFCKTYLYSIFVRLSENLESIRQKIYHKNRKLQSLASRGWEKTFEDNKSALIQCYQSLNSQKKYDVTLLLNLAKRKQNHRIYSLLPPKSRKSQITLNPIQRVDSKKLIRTNSVQVPSVRRDKLEALISAKVGSSTRISKRSKKKFDTEKRAEKTEDCIPLKKKQKQKSSFKPLYGILGIKLLKMQSSSSFRLEMEEQALQRNRTIKEERDKYRENFELRTIYLKLSKKKKNQN